MTDVYERKAQFVKELETFYKVKVGLTGGLARMDYVKSDITEWVYVTYNTRSQKCFPVPYENNRGILIEFVKFLNNFDDYRWLRDDEALFHKEFLEG